MAPRLLFFLAALGLAGCSFAPKYTGANGDRVSARGVRVSVTASYEAGFVPARAGEFQVFRVAIRNLGATPVTFSTRDFSLLDAGGRQYAALLPTEMRDSHGRWYCRPPHYFPGDPWGWGWNHGPYPPYGTYGPYGPYGAYGYEYDCYPPGAAMFEDSLLPAPPLLPGAKMVGYLFFRGGIDDSEALTLVVSPPGEAPIRLPFVRR